MATNDRFSASGFNPEVRSGTIVGTLILQDGMVRFEWPGGAVEMPVHDLKLQAGGHNNEQIFFSHPDVPGWTLYVKGEAVLEHPVLAGHSMQSELRRQIAGAKKAHRPLLWISFIVIAFVVLAIAVLLALKDPLVRWIADRIPPAWEQNLGGTILAQLKAGGGFVDDPEAQQTLQAVASRVLRGVPETPYNFQFYLLQDTNINAFALPGGHVVVNTGLIHSATEEQLAGVLAHEIAHVTHQHGLRKMIDAAGLGMVIQAVFGDASGLLAWMGQSSEFLLRQKYSRDFEREADDAGWEYLVAAGLEPKGMIEFFKKLHELEQNRAQPPALLNTHPATEERIRRLEDKLGGTFDR